MTYMLLTSSDLHCGSCSSNLYNVLEKIGEQNISVNILNSEFAFEFEENKIADQDVIKEINKNGFKTNILEKYIY